MQRTVQDIMENEMLKRNAVRIGFLPTARAKGIGEGFLAVEAVGHLVCNGVCCVKVGFFGKLARGGADTEPSLFICPFTLIGNVVMLT